VKWSAKVDGINTTIAVNLADAEKLENAATTANTLANETREAAKSATADKPDAPTPTAPRRH
jgi:hypothetical protein